MNTNTARRRCAVATTSLLAITAATGGAAFAQTTPGAEIDDSVSEVVVVGARASQQSSIERKKRAATPTDSIVADDVGSFPDRNIAEAISRVAGTALNRNGFGEGEGVSIRGSSMDQTRIELDGLGVQSTYGLSLGNSRGADLRELPSDLIKSVDIVKGSTADMTEGSLTGSVLVKTRTGLDFKKPYLSLRVGAEQNSVTEKWTPDYNLVASRKFFGDRLGVIFNGSYRGVENVGHSQENAGSNSNDGEGTLWDWDNSAQKTFTFNPALVGGRTGDTVLANSAETPRTLLAKSAAAATKAACLATFPFLATGSDALKTQRLNEQYTCLNQWNDLAPGNLRSFMNSQTDKRTSADLRFDYRVNDKLTVFAKVNRSERLTNDQNRSRTLGNPIVNPAGRFFVTPGTPTMPAQRYVNQDATGTGRGYYNWTLANLFPTPPSCPTISTPAQYATCDQSNPMIGRGDNGAGSPLLLVGQPVFPATVPATFQSVPLRGMVTNIDPSTVKVDANHNVLSWTQYDNSVNIDQINNYQPSITEYAQVGGEYNGERMRIEFIAGATKATSSRIDQRTNRQYNYGKADIAVNSAGIWGYTLPSTYDDTNPDNFVQLQPAIAGTVGSVASATNPFTFPAVPAESRPLLSASSNVTGRPTASEASERVAKFDLTYDLKDFSPFFTRIKTGFNYRTNEAQRWGGGGATIKDPVGVFGTPGYIPGVYLPQANVSGTYRACQETTRLPGTNGPTDLGGSIFQRDGIIGSAETTDSGLCNFGFVVTNPTIPRQGQDTLTEAQLKALFRDTTEVSDQVFFNSYETEGMGWNGVRTGDLFAQLGSGQFANLDCIKVCTATDGKEYAQPITKVLESTTAAYYVLDFETENLPFGMTFNGNVGMRGVHTTVEATGQLVLQNIRISGVNPPVPPSTIPTAIIDTRTFRQNVSLSRQTLDFLPSYNLNLWVLPDQVAVRYYYGKQIARQNIGQLVPSGTCQIDDRNIPGSQFFDGDDQSTCSGRIGNPELKPLTTVNQSVNVEWYPNRDTTVALAYQKTDIRIGGTQNVDRVGPLFAGSSQTDPLTGAPLSNLIFQYPTYQNGPGFERTGLEFTAKTAFTFLPWLFRHTGADFNYSTLKASNASTAEIDPITGDVQPPRGQAEYYTNLSLWYDDGRTQVRVSYQGKASTFNGITSLSGSINRNFPTAANAGVAPPYYPGQPQFTDETKYWDAKGSYNVNENIQVFLEATNITKQAQILSTGEYRPYADGTPNVMRVGYSGMRVRTGVTFKFQ